MRARLQLIFRGSECVSANNGTSHCQVHAEFIVFCDDGESEFSMDLTMAGTIICADTFTPSEYELQSCSRIQLTSPTPWDPYKVSLHQSSLTLDDVMAHKRQVSTTHSSFHSNKDQGGIDYSHKYSNQLFNLTSMRRRICSMSIIPESLTRDNNIDPGNTDAVLPPTFQSSDRHTNVTPQSLIERWGISLQTASKTLHNAET